MRINVTKQFIEHAIPRDSHRCMIADAVKAKIPNAKFITVDLQTVRYSDLTSGKRYFFLTKPVAGAAIITFDRGDAVKPFSFELGQPIRVIDVKREWSGDPDKLERAQRKYDKKRKHGGPKFAGMSRDREYGLRALKS